MASTRALAAPMERALLFPLSSLAFVMAHETVPQVSLLAPPPAFGAGLGPFLLVEFSHCIGNIAGGRTEQQKWKFSRSFHHLCLEADLGAESDTSFWHVCSRAGGGSWAEWERAEGRLVDQDSGRIQVTHREKGSMQFSLLPKFPFF